MKLSDYPEGRWYRNEEVVDIARINFGCGMSLGVIVGSLIIIVLWYFTG